MGVSSESQEALIASRRSKRWLAGTAIFTALNLAGGVVAAAMGELVHASVHAALMLIGANVVWILASRRDSNGLARSASTATELSQLGDRLAQIQQSIDAIGIEVERIGEGQRYLTHLFAPNDSSRTPDDADAIERRSRQALPKDRPS